MIATRCIAVFVLVAVQDMMNKPVPFKSPSAVLQQHVNPEHAAHFAAVDGMKDVDMVDDGLPSGTPSDNKQKQEQL